MPNYDLPFHTIESSNLSHAWGRAFLKSMEPAGTPPMIVSISNLQDGWAEDETIRGELDRSLAALDEYTCHTVANTIFPLHTWNQEKPRHELFKRYDNAWPSIKRHHNNRNGTYFRRLTAFRDGEGSVNQLDHIISIWLGEEIKEPTRRHSALQASIFDPRSDHTKEPVRGFPCLQQVSFTPLGPKGAGGLAVTGLYPTQLFFEKAYGNYLGLCHLGQFMAAEMKLDLVRVNCITIKAQHSQKRTKSDLRALEATVTSILDESQDAKLTTEIMDGYHATEVTRQQAYRVRGT